MRILLTGGSRFLGQGLIRRLGPSHELRLLDCGSSRELAGCQAMVHLWSESTGPLETEARAAGVGPIIRVLAWTDPLVHPVEACTLRLPPLIGPGDPDGTVGRWLSAADTEPPSGRAVMVDHRDALGGIESALWKGKQAHQYTLVGANPTWVQLAELLRGFGGAGGVSGTWGEDAGVLSTHKEAAELGWWSRGLERSLNDTVASL